MKVPSQELLLNKLEAYIKEKGLTNAEIAKELDVSLTCVYQWRTGKTKLSLYNYFLLIKFFYNIDTSSEENELK